MVEIYFVHNIDGSMYEDLITKVINQGSKIENVSGTMNVVFMNNEEIQQFNMQYRGKDYATDVLSFVDGEDEHLGDILISLEKCEEQRIEYGHSFERELAFLSCHGFLHLCGYDHMTDVEEKEMIAKQNEILDSLNIRR